MTANDVEMSEAVVCCCALRQMKILKAGCPGGKSFHSRLWSAVIFTDGLRLQHPQKQLRAQEPASLDTSHITAYLEQI